ncbi:HvfC/BufC N-terminal domain-containing protein [Burkholderia aenigmatica]|uniref:HvfC/BufC N-terminal domain-containing protein n=1 Tax=Burkholderia aenigmatica TaxID=2015348 RepID=UPI0026562D7A|nr:DNA-binding domain-containing protein [Burkholderia aenigmatica]MDN7876565.1 DNA-binding domain-containing protein [Burkholderia aenigmatica]
MNLPPPTLVELQHAVRRRLHGAADDVLPWIVPDGFAPEARLSIYRNTATAVLMNAICLAFPAVRRLVGAACFEGAAARFVDASPPESAWLDEYGAAFSDFLDQLPEVASIPYLADVARLEWHVNRVLHATDTPALEVVRLTSLDEGALGALRLCPRPAVRLAHCAFPADVIWRAVLEQDESVMREIRLDDGPVNLLVQRTAEGIDAVRLGDAEHRVAMALFAGESIRDALSLAPPADGYRLLTTLLARECFVDIASESDAGPLSGGSTPCPM